MDRLLVPLTPVIALLLWGVISPRSQWQKLFAWGYRNPEANEPSDAAYMLTRIGNVVMLGVLAWAVLGLPLPGGHAGARPAATPQRPAVEDLYEAFGVDEATAVMPPVVTGSPKSTRPVKVVRYQKVDATRPPVYLGQALTGKTGDWLILGVRADTPPTGVRINEQVPFDLYVGVLTGCTVSCPTTPISSGKKFYLVPVRLSRPLGSRLVYDVTGELVP
ncbi:hypothetical protein ACWT_3598 [Actinoplanes sp. SE50]|uniref:hypothetical protein n=1 Tax=unclassified Actinoplanes TaxID=2626549 RepID=UPI00023EC2AD|nr:MULTISPECIES: hypothetical protein [unclassified Actinoplanes]AEV84621.1 hypothetical protein ACPL_3726 [Actinoplanes sp. SE50/110]ATO83013.1 hypothetical protein ACWT_3598 [Actinoplanes sp. SE50]SLM00421.1 hypothetical protein ACSP50_3653 [Actinoplanes sp. SE50/110]